MVGSRKPVNNLVIRFSGSDGTTHIGHAERVPGPRFNVSIDFADVPAGTEWRVELWKVEATAARLMFAILLPADLEPGMSLRAGTLAAAAE